MGTTASNFRVFAPADAKGGKPTSADKTALLFIEYQNEFTTEGGKLHGAVKPVMEENDMLKKSASIMNAARAKGVKIFHAPISAHLTSTIQELLELRAQLGIQLPAS